MIKYLTAIFFFVGLFIGVFFIVKHEKKRKQDKTVLVDTTSENWAKRNLVVNDSIYFPVQTVSVSNDSTIMISDPAEQKYDEIMKSLRKIDSILTEMKKR